MRIKDILKFNRDAFFDGAVQIDWFYDDNIREKVAKSYVFHGKEYHGVDNRNLIDTSSYVKRIVEKLYVDKQSNRFLLTIAGYGTGKSHLGVTLATLLGKEGTEREIVLEKIKDIDKEDYKYIREHLRGKNLVLTLNGMNDFNLNSQILKVAKLALEKLGVDDSFLKDMTKAYDVAEHFIKNNYDNFSNRFIEYSKNSNKYKLSENLKNDLLTNIRDDIKAFEIVNEVYKEVTSNYIKWDEGISTGEIINKLNKHLCVDNNIFDNIVILFDEFGRFIEYAGVYGTVAGESGLQQMFEAVQNANRNVMFIGLIQSDLNAYLNRVSNSSNIKRYVGRYEGSEKLYISSNLETILANLINKVDDEKYEKVISDRIDGVLSKYYNNLFSSICRWLPNSNIVWKNDNLFNRIVSKGTYPLNPLTVWLLCNSSEWMQQRSTLTFAEEIFEKYGESELFGDELVEVYATELIKSKFFNELLSAEEKGIQNSQHCINYKNIEAQYEEKLTDKQLDVLRGVLISNIGKFKFFDKADNITGIKYITGINKDVDKLLEQLENEFGIISFDDKINRYEFVASGNSINDYRRTFFKYRAIAKLDTVKITDPQVIEDLALDRCFETEFSANKGIKTKEWRFEKEFIDIKELTEGYIGSLVSRVRKATNGEEARGIYLWVYCDSENYNIEKVARYVKNTLATESGIVVSILNDATNDLKEQILNLEILSKFTAEEREKYSKLYKKYLADARKKAVRAFTSLANKKTYITSNGISNSNERANRYCNKIFEEIYFKTIPFMFDGFDKKSLAKAKNGYKQVLDILLSERFKNSQAVSAISQEIKNRLNALLREDYDNSWGILNKNYRLISPKNTEVFNIVKEITERIEKSTSIKGVTLLNKYLLPPYGLNIYQLNLLMIYILVEDKNIRMINGGKNIKRIDLSRELVDKFNLEIILKCEFFIEEMNTKDKLERLFNEANRNKYPENCREILDKLKIIADSDDIPEDLIDQKYMIEKKLNDGIKLNFDIKNKLEEFEVITKNVRSKFELLKAFVELNKIISYINKKLSFGYEFSEQKRKEFNDIDNEFRKMIREETPRFIKGLNFTIKEISEYKRKYSDICYNNLIKIKEYELAEALKNKVKEVIDNIEREEEFKGLSKSIEEIYLKVKANINMKYSDIEEVLNQVNILKEEATNEKIPSSLKNKFIDELKEIEELIFDQKRKQSKLIEDIKVLISGLNDESKLNILNTKINKALDLEIRSESIEDICVIKEDIDNYRVDVYDLNSNQLNWSNIDSLRDELIGKYDSSILLPLIEQKLKEKINTLNLQDSKWKKENLDIKFSTLSLDQCMAWKNRVSNIPYYISDKTLELLDEKRKEVDKKIADKRVEGAISVFNSLNDEEKKIFLEKIKN